MSIAKGKLYSFEVDFYTNLVENQILKRNTEQITEREQMYTYELKSILNIKLISRATKLRIYKINIEIQIIFLEVPVQYGK